MLKIIILFSTKLDPGFKGVYAWAWANKFVEFEKLLPSYASVSKANVKYE